MFWLIRTLKQKTKKSLWWYENKNIKGELENIRLLKCALVCKILDFNSNEAGGIQFDFGLFREVVQELINEYHAATKPDYITWGTTQVQFFYYYNYVRMFNRAYSLDINKVTGSFIFKFFMRIEYLQYFAGNSTCVFM